MSAYSDAKKITTDIEKQYLISVESKLIELNELITTANSDLGTDSPQSAVIQFFGRITMNISNLTNYDLTSLKAQYGLVDPSNGTTTMITPTT